MAGAKTILGQSVSFKMGKRKARVQSVEIFTDDGRIMPTELDVLRGCMVDHEKKVGFLISAENQMTNESGEWVQALGERSCLPLCSIKPLTDAVMLKLKQIINRIFHEAHEAAKMEQYELAKANAFLDKLTWMVIAPCITFLLIFAVQHFWG